MDVQKLKQKFPHIAPKNLFFFFFADPSFCRIFFLQFCWVRIWVRVSYAISFSVQLY